MFFPLAKLAPSGALAAIALISTALYIVNTAEIANGWVGAGPVATVCVFSSKPPTSAAKLVLAETGREREIVQAGFVVDRSATRCSGFGAALFASIVITTSVTTVAFWAYQGFLFYTEDRWIPLTWFAVTGVFANN